MKHFFQTRLALLAALPIGASLALAFAPFGGWPLAVLCPVYLFLAWHYLEPRRAAKVGFLFTAGLFLAGTYWLYHTIHEVGHAPAWIALFLMFGMVAIIGGYTAAVGYAITRWLRPKLPEERTSVCFTVLTVPAAWTLLEWFRGWFLSGFPWFALGYSQTDSPLVGFAPIGGVYTISLLVAMSSGALIALIIGTNRTRIVAAAALVVIWASGAILKHHEWTQPIGRPLTAAIVQGAVPQDLKWSQGYLNSTLELYQRLTLPHFGKDIILWPEAALPAVPEQVQDYLDTMWRTARSNRSTLITGLLHYGDGGGDDIRNGLLALDAEAQWYDKRRLVPFGEFFPVPAFIREWMRLKDLPHSDISPGARDQPALRAAGQKIAATICYEDAYGAEQLEVLKEATLLVNVTNDAWFGDTTAAPQHLQISRMRVIEAGRPLLRAANDGISAIISADGTVERTLPRFQPGVLVGVIQPRTGLPPYAQVGNVPLVVLCLLLLAGGFWTIRRASSPS
jgi:apolipoprotein N-acyltransferase